MSLFSGFSTAGDEERAIRLSRAVSEKTHLLLARLARMHSGRDVGMGTHGVHTCVECGKPHPCPTYQAIIDTDGEKP